MRKGKRRHCMSQSEMLTSLAAQSLKGELMKGHSVRIHAELDVLEKLRTCGLGTRGSKKRAKARSEKEGAQEEPPKFMDITLEEAYFLQSSLQCLQIMPEEQQEQQQEGKDAEVKPADRPALPVRVRHHGLHHGIVSRPGIHGLEEQLLYEIDTASKPPQTSGLPSERNCKPLTNAEMWSKCTEKVPDWSYWYTTYHHFRSKGWLPKPGAQFGGHFVLYRSHPEVDHAEFVVRCMTGRQLVTQQAPGGPPSEIDGPTAVQGSPATAAANSPLAGEAHADANHFAWPELLANVRVAGQVRKRLVLLYVHFPADAEHGSPSCLQSATVDEMQLLRWKSSKK